MKEIFNFAILSVLMLMIVLCVISPISVYAEGNDDLNQTAYAWINLICDDDDITLDYSDISKDINVVKTSADEYVTTAESAGKLLRSGMVDRAKTVILNYKIPTSKLSDSKWFSKLCDEILEYAFMHTGVPKEGDYLKYNVKGYSSKASYYSYTNYTYTTITFTFTYYTTLKQENQLDTAITELKKNLDNDEKSEYKAVRNIYDYICDNVKYNHGSNPVKYTAYSALVNKSAVCQGYAVLFYRLALEYDIDTRVISGKGRSQSHTWNIVKVDGKYYNADTTWDAGKNNYQYFLIGSNDFTDHTRNDEYLTSSFKSEYPVTEKNYRCKNHMWNDFYTIDKKATYASDGKKSIHCSICGAQNPKSVIVLKKLICKLPSPKTLNTTLTANFGTNAGYDDMKITWSKVEGASGYNIKYRKKGTKVWKNAYTVNKYLYLKNLTDGVRYEISVYPYIKEKGVRYNSSNFKRIDSVYTLKRVKITTKKRNIGNNITIKWNDIQGESGYQIYRATSKDGTYKKIGTVKKYNSKTHSLKIKAKKGVVYWYKVRAYKTVGSKCVFGPWSDKVKFMR